MATFELKQTVFTYELGQEVSQSIDDYVICPDRIKKSLTLNLKRVNSVSYTHLRAHET